MRPVASIGWLRMTKCWVVTGGAGFIGSHVADALTALGIRVRIFDNFSTGLRTNLLHLNPTPEIVEGDLADAKAVTKALTDAEVVFHLGALPSVQRSVETPDVTHQACATGTLNVLDAARRCGVRRVVYAGSSSAYGGQSTESGQSEEAMPQPRSPYAAAKLAGEMYAQAFAATYGLETVRVRFFNIYGPRQRPDSPYSGVIALFIAALSQGRAPQIQGDGRQSRDFTYVGDAVQALLKAADTPGISGRVYNVGAGGSVTILELVQILNRLLGTAIQPSFQPPRPGDVRFSRADISRARAELGYRPEVSVEEGLRRTLKWYQERDASVKTIR